MISRAAAARHYDKSLRSHERGDDASGNMDANFTHRTVAAAWTTVAGHTVASTTVSSFRIFPPERGGGSTSLSCKAQRQSDVGKSRTLFRTPARARWWDTTYTHALDRGKTMVEKRSAGVVCKCKSTVTDKCSKGLIKGRASVCVKCRKHDDDGNGK